MVDLLIDSRASLRPNNEGAIFSLKQYPIFFIPSGLQGSVVPFSCPYQNLLSGQKKKKTSCHLYMLINKTAAAAAAKSLQSYPTLCDPIDGSPLGSLVPGILQAKTLEWVAISFSNA